MEHVRARSPQAPLATAAGCLLLVFLVLFPKGGVRMAGLPLTWGYLGLALLTPLALAVRILAMPLRFPLRVLAAVGMLLPMQALFVYAGVFYGMVSPQYTFSTFVGLFALPWIFLLLFGPFFPMLDGARLARWMCGCIFLAAVWGIFLFFLHPLTGHYIEIPYLTVNASDFGDLETTKDIARGGYFFKLISTYNNGNLYGVATLLLLPMYLRLENSRLRRLTLRVALLLTLSRTVWVGLILNEVLSLLPPLLRQVRTFPILFLGEARRRFVAVVVTMTFVFASVLFTTWQGGYLQFLFDRTLGNRLVEVQAASGTSFLPEQAIYGFREVLYASAAQFWGWSGLVAFTLIMFSPLLLLGSEPQILGQPLRRAALKGLLIYAVMAGSDGAFNFIPVMAFYWFVYAVFVYGWPGSQSWASGLPPVRERLGAGFGRLLGRGRLRRRLRLA